MTEPSKTMFDVVFNETCLEDYYGLRSILFNPDVIIDIGANVGAFTSHARFLFPAAKIIAVEPDLDNFAYLLRYTHHFPGVTFVQKALGTGHIYRSKITPVPPYYGTLESFVTLDQLGFPEAEIAKPPAGNEGRDGLPIYEEAPEIQSVALPELIEKYSTPEDKLLVKMDCEGGENYIFAHAPSMKALRRIDFLTMETHYYTKGTGTEYEANKETVAAGLLSLSETHHCYLKDETRQFRAIRKGING